MLKRETENGTESGRELNTENVIYLKDCVRQAKNDILYVFYNIVKTVIQFQVYLYLENVWF